MTDEVKKLIDDFKIITNKKWIKSISKSFGSIGITFEKELGKNPDALYFPDYYGTEINVLVDIVGIHYFYLRLRLMDRLFRRLIE